MGRKKLMDMLKPTAPFEVSLLSLMLMSSSLDDLFYNHRIGPSTISNPGKKIAH
jgi:hypothetical protein